MPIVSGPAPGVLRENPFLNELIVSNILQNFKSVHELKPLRQVCRLWNRLAIYQWRPVATIKLGATVESDCWSFDDFWRHFQDPNDPHEFGKKPFTKYILSGINISDYPALQILGDDPGTSNFWSSIGPIMTYLQFQNCTFPASGPASCQKILGEKLPRLRTLLLTDNHAVPSEHLQHTWVFEVLETTGEEAFRSGMKIIPNLNTIKVSGETPMNLCAILLNSPNIQNLHLAGDAGRTTDHNFAQLKQALLIKSILDDETFQLQHLDLLNMDIYKMRFSIGIISLAGLITMPLPLKHLSLTVPSNVPSSQLTGVWRQYGKTLEVLNIFRPPHAWTPFYKFDQRQPMNSLSELYLYGTVVEDLICLKHLRNLKVLHVDPKCYDKVDRIIGHRYPVKVTKGRPTYAPCLGKNMINPKDRAKMCLLKMEKLHLDTQTFLLCSATYLTTHVDTLHAWMPNLKVLETNLDLNGFRTVCRLMPRLEELVLLFESRVGDEAVTGLKTGQTENPHPDNVTTFTNLKRFELKSLCKMPESFDENRLGDHSVDHGFLKMDTLQKVIIAASRKMSEEAEERLKRHVAQVQMIRNYDDKQPHGTGECCAVKLAMDQLRNSNI